MPTTIETPPEAAFVRRRWPRGRLWLIFATTLLLPFAAEVYRVTFGANFHTVVAGRVYRCAQPNVAELSRMIATEGIRTVINLRGSCDPLDWYIDEARTTHQHNISQEDICFSAGRLPPVPEMRRLIEVLEHTQYPVLLHCRRGADRTGLAAAVVLLLTTDTALDDACSQLGLRFGHVAVGRCAQLDEFLVFYRKWLAAQSITHSRDNFRHWALDCYCPGSCWSELAFTQTPPSTVLAADPTSFHVRVHNASLLPWVFTPQWLAGVHLGCHIFDDQDSLIDVVKAGLQDGILRPGENMDFALTIPPLRKPGRYCLRMDMVDEQQCWFYQTGSKPLEMELIVRE